jgi:uncharacterized protein with beta-barrel porin domain
LPYADDDALAYAGRSSKAKRDIYAALTPKDRLSFEARWSAWGAAYGGSQSTDGDTNTGSHRVTSRVYGLVGGADYHAAADMLLGFALAGGGTNFGVDTGLGGGRSDLFQLGGFARKSFGPAYVTGTAAYGWQDVTTDRTVTAAGSDRLHAEFRTNTLAGRIESGWRMPTGVQASITPYAAAQAIRLMLPGYGETATSGTGTFALSYAARDVTATRTELGARADSRYRLRDGTLTLRGRLAWAHDYNRDVQAQATFQTLPGASFVVNGARPAADSALASAGAEMAWTNHVSLAATFEGEFSNTTQSYAGKGVARYVW